MAETVLIVGAGAGLSASVARRFAKDGAQIALAARNTDKLADLAGELGAGVYPCDVTERAAVDAMVGAVTRDLGVPDVVLFNASGRQRGPFTELDPEAVKQALLVSCYGGYLLCNAVVPAMLERGSGTILLTGASASVKGYPRSAPFAMGKFGLRGLAQSLARELQPEGIHVAHFVIDGGIRSAARPDDGRDALLDPDAIAETYFQVARQHRSAWTWEVELRPWVESF
ncbi:SDR family NAD(P)-dependent oxidoreductase [Pelagibius marinus]|uniref:SDR family NAD(P)-dependent oxidoreductase n=1 Tax=Pelagibius marinus TaxID=2762760 RepID=UPI0018727A5C|nr:SDR family NAD(P)-dependent oxidoreductase [Pelagibius marinus]